MFVLNFWKDREKFTNKHGSRYQDLSGFILKKENECSRLFRSWEDLICPLVAALQL